MNKPENLVLLTSDEDEDVLTTATTNKRVMDDSQTLYNDGKRQRTSLSQSEASQDRIAAGGEELLETQLIVDSDASAGGSVYPTQIGHHANDEYERIERALLPTQLIVESQQKSMSERVMTQESQALASTQAIFNPDSEEDSQRYGEAGDSQRYREIGDTQPVAEDEEVQVYQTPPRAQEREGDVGAHERLASNNYVPESPLATAAAAAAEIPSSMPEGGDGQVCDDNDAGNEGDDEQSADEDISPGVPGEEDRYNPGAEMSLQALQDEDETELAADGYDDLFPTLTVSRLGEGDGDSGMVPRREDGGSAESLPELALELLAAADVEVPHDTTAGIIDGAPPESDKSERAPVVQKKTVSRKRTAAMVSTATDNRRTMSIDFLLTSRRSPLVDLPSLSCLINEATFMSLPLESQRKLVGLLPAVDKTRDEKGEEGIRVGFFESNMVLHDAMRYLQDDLREGRYMKGYSNEVKKARKVIDEGGIEKYKEDKFEQWWGKRARE